jgi:hypothetical protein
MAKMFQLRCKSCTHMLMVFFGPFPSLNCVITSSFSFCSLNNVAIFVVADQRGIVLVLVLVLRFKYQLILF